MIVSVVLAIGKSKDVTMQRSLCDCSNFKQDILFWEISSESRRGYP